MRPLGVNAQNKLRNFRGSNFAKNITNRDYRTWLYFNKVELQTTDQASPTRKGSSMLMSCRMVRMFWAWENHGWGRGCMCLGLHYGLSIPCQWGHELRRKSYVVHSVSAYHRICHRTFPLIRRCQWVQFIATYISINPKVLTTATQFPLILLCQMKCFGSREAAPAPARESLVRKVFLLVLYVLWVIVNLIWL